MITAADILHDLETIAYRRLVSGYPDRVALAGVRALLDCLYLNFRGQFMYVPTHFNRDARTRYEQIWHDFTGHNHDALALKYKMSRQRIYIIINQMRTAHVRKRQDDLFAADIAAEDSRPLTQIVFESYLPHELERAGVCPDDAQALAGELFQHLCVTYPGIAIRITHAMWQQRHGGDNGDLFAETA